MRLFSMEAIKAGFNRAAPSYEQHALLQKNVLTRLFELLDPLMPRQARVLDAGCGPGYLADFLSDRQWTMIQLDIAYAMCVRAMARNNMVLNADLERLPFPDNHFDGVISSLTLQWVNDKDLAFSEICRTLKPGGYAGVTTFGPRTLGELKEAFASVDALPHVSTFPGAHECMEQIARAGLEIVRSDILREKHYFTDVVSIMQNLKATGATNKMMGRGRGLMRRGQLEAVKEAYARYYQTPLGIPATWEIYYFIVRKPR